jgi:hypothetical protein
MLTFLEQFTATFRKTVPRSIVSDGGKGPFAHCWIQPKGILSSMGSSGSTRGNVRQYAERISASNVPAVASSQPPSPEITVSESIETTPNLSNVMAPPNDIPELPNAHTLAIQGSDDTQQGFLRRIPNLSFMLAAKFVPPKENKG